jgi:hypothetical protein
MDPVRGLETSSGTHPVTYAVGTVAISPRGKATGGMQPELWSQESKGILGGVRLGKNA